jgi:CDP-2,3-bis-(O-geranylgeranyl)-sn-glycerol synthase
MAHPELIVELLVLLTVANGTPVVVKKLFGDFLAYPLDGGRTFLDGRPLFGSAKTIRGIVASIVTTAASAPLIGVRFTTGLVVAVSAMGGDLLSSFVKRRMGYAASGRTLGIDQIPESLLPAVICKDLLELSLADIVFVVALFFLGEIVLSRILFRLHIRDQPY